MTRTSLMEQQIAGDWDEPLSRQLEDGNNRRQCKGGQLPDVVMPRCTAAEAPISSLMLQPNSPAPARSSIAARSSTAVRTEQDLGASADFGTPGAALPRPSVIVSHSEIRQRLGNLAHGSSEHGAFAPLNLSVLQSFDAASPRAPPPPPARDTCVLVCTRVSGAHELGAFSLRARKRDGARTERKAHSEGVSTGGAFGSLTVAAGSSTSRAMGATGRKAGENGGGAFAPLDKRPPSSNGWGSTSVAAAGAFSPLETRQPSSHGGATKDLHELQAFSPLVKMPSLSKLDTALEEGALALHTHSSSTRLASPRSGAFGETGARPPSSSGVSVVSSVGTFGQSSLDGLTPPRIAILGASRGALSQGLSRQQVPGEHAKRRAEALIKDAWMALAGGELDLAQELGEKGRQEWTNAGQPEGLNIKLGQLNAKFSECKRQAPLRLAEEEERKQRENHLHVVVEEEVSFRNDMQQRVSEALAGGQIVETHEAEPAGTPEGWIHLKAFDTGQDYWVNTANGQRVQKQPTDCAAADKLINEVLELLGQVQVAKARERLEMALECLEKANVRDRDQMCADLHDRITRRAADMCAQADSQALQASRAVEWGDLAKARALVAAARSTYCSALDPRLDAAVLDESIRNVDAVERRIETQQEHARHRDKGNAAVLQVKAALHERDVLRARMALIDAETAYVASGDVDESHSTGPKAEELQRLKVLLEAHNDIRLRGDEALAAARSAFARGDFLATQEQTSKAESCYLKAGVDRDTSTELLKPVQLLVSQLQDFLQGKRRSLDISESSASDTDLQDDGDKRDEEDDSDEKDEQVYNFTKGSLSPKRGEEAAASRGGVASSVAQGRFQRSHVALAPTTVRQATVPSDAPAQLTPQPPPGRKGATAPQQLSALQPRPPPARNFDTLPPVAHGTALKEFQAAMPHQAQSKQSTPGQPPAGSRPHHSGGGRPVPQSLLSSPVAGASRAGAGRSSDAHHGSAGRHKAAPPPAPPVRVQQASHPELLTSDRLDQAGAKEALQDREADGLMSRRRRNQLLLWWKSSALEAAAERQRHAASLIPDDTTATKALSAVDELLGAADKALLQARTGHAGKLSKVEQAMRQVAEARQILDAARLSQRDQALHDMQKRTEEVLKWARLVEDAESAKTKAQHALASKMWEAVVMHSDAAIDAFEAAGEMDQVYAMEDLKQRAAQAQARQQHGINADEAVARGETALKDALLTTASNEAQCATDEYVAAVAGLPDKLRSLLQRISEAVAAADAAVSAAKAAQLREQGNQALEDAGACIADKDFDDARLAIAKARSFFEQANCLHDISGVLASLEAKVARGEGLETCLKRARAAFEACKLGLARVLPLKNGKEKRAILIAARDECFTAIAGFQEAGEENVASQARQMLADVEQRIRETNTSEEADAAIASAEAHLTHQRFGEARREGAQAMLFLAKVSPSTSLTQTPAIIFFVNICFFGVCVPRASLSSRARFVPTFCPILRPH